MADKEVTELDKAINRGKNSRYLVPMLLGFLIVGGLASFLDDACTIRKHVGLPCQEDQNELSSDVRAVLEDRAGKITVWLDGLIAEIDATNFDYQQTNNCGPASLEHIEASNPSVQKTIARCDAVAKKTFDLMQSIRAAKDDFIKLHRAHLEHLADGNDLAAHETASNIFQLIEQTKQAISTGIVGFDDEEDKNVGYLHGYPDVVLALRYERPEEVFDPYTKCIQSPNYLNCTD